MTPNAPGVINTNNTVIPQLSVADRAYNEIKIVLDSNFPEADKTQAIDRELRKMLSIGDTAIDSTTIPGATDLKNSLATAKRDIMAAQTGGYPEDVVKSIISFQIAKLLNDPYVVSLTGGSQLAPTNTSSPAAGTASQQSINQPTSQPNTLPANNTVAPANTIAPATSATTNPNAQGQGGLSNTVVNGAGQGAPESDANKITRLTNELAFAEGRLGKYGNGIVALELATHPGQIGKFLRYKMRDKMIARKVRNPYSMLYYLRDGQTRRFTKHDKKITEAPQVCKDLLAEYRAMANNPNEMEYKIIEAKKRIKLLEAIQPMIEKVQKIDAKTILSGK